MSSATAAQRPASSPQHAELSLERWNPQHRVQHFLMAFSMIGLILSGFLMKYAYMPWSQNMLGTLGGVHSVLFFHKIMAGILFYDCIHHLVYVAVYVKKHGPTWDMMPSVKDLKDAIQHALSLLNLGPEPKYDRYTYLEKFEYLSIFWGMAVMGATGLALWFPEYAARLVPGWGLDISRIFHSNEAFVAMLALFYGHFFTVHFNPDVFPMSNVWYNGKISLHHMQQEHPLELERLAKQGKLPAAMVEAINGHAVAHHQTASWRALLAFAELIFYSALFYWLLVTFVPMLLS